MAVTWPNEWAHRGMGLQWKPRRNAYKTSLWPLSVQGICRVEASVSSPSLSLSLSSSASMAKLCALPLFFGFLAFSAVFCLGFASPSNFTDLFQPSWAFDHFLYEGDVLKMKLDSYSGAGFASKSKYMFGKVSIKIKLVEGDSAGTVTAFYMSSDGPNHNEFDFEFLGNTTGEPYLIQTNVYVSGVGNREQRLNLWFDPTEDFHDYEILWTDLKVVFLVDGTPVRVHSNMEKHGLPFPKDQPMGVYSSIWNADDWATQGGRVKTDWSHAPFIASYRGFDIDACECSVAVTADDNIKKCSKNGGNKFWWDEPALAELNVHQSHQLLWVRANHLVYDYCTDTARFPVIPIECQHHHH